MDTYSSTDIKALATALINVQRTLQPASKDALNPFTKSRYATLNSVMEACRNALTDNGIWLTQYPVPAEPGHLGLVTKLTHAASGQWQASMAVVPLPKADPQGLGIAMTYARRYTISAMLGIVTEEDTDGAVPEKDLPRIDGVSFTMVTSQDGRPCIVASGNTQQKKALLLGAGFQWNPQRKIWWKYAEAA